MSDSEVVRIESLSKVYGKGHTAVTALRGAQLAVDRGELVAVLGPSGSGKTTLLTAIAGIVEPSAGRVVISGTVLYDDGWRIRDLRRFRREHLGFIFQSVEFRTFSGDLSSRLTVASASPNPL